VDGADRQQESIVVESQLTRHRTLYGGAAASLSLSRIAPRCWPASTVDAIVRGLPLPLLFMGAAQPLGAGMMRSLLVLSFHPAKRRRAPAARRNTMPGQSGAGSLRRSYQRAGIESGGRQGACPALCFLPGDSLESPDRLARRKLQEEVHLETSLVVEK
jgi:hypothetical protein